MFQMRLCKNAVAQFIFLCSTGEDFAEQLGSINQATTEMPKIERK